MNYRQFWKKAGKKDCDKWELSKQVRVKTILKKLNYNSVFEVGCGDGEFSKLIQKNYTGIDISPERVEKNPYNVIVGDFLDCNFKTKFDLVCCSHVLLHLPDELARVCYSKMKQLSKKYIILIEPNIHKYHNLSWKEMNYPHDYQTFDSFEEYELDEKVTLFLK